MTYKLSFIKKFKHKNKTIDLIFFDWKLRLYSIIYYLFNLYKFIQFHFKFLLFICENS